MVDPFAKNSNRCWEAMEGSRARQRLALVQLTRPAATAKLIGLPEMRE
jgi:hypothetical protein